MGWGIGAWRIAALVVVTGCAGAGSNGENGSPGLGDDGEGDGETTMGELESSSEGDDESAAPTPPPDLGPCDSDADCVIADDSCFEAQGVCEAGGCVNPPKAVGSACDDGDGCTGPDVCDAAGGCFGATIDCSFPNASGGACVAGQCQGMQCDAPFGNCDADWTNGCEASLTTATDCGACGSPCAAGDNATAECSTGTCLVTCDEPYEDCDGDPGNGCEIPTGVPNQCDTLGLNPVDGCWTAWCGSSQHEDAVNFGSWFCFECTTCHSPSAGQCQWCSHDAGVWFPADSCACGAFEDLVCEV